MSIESKLIDVLSAKQSIKEAISRKCPTIPPSGILSSWPESIESIPSGSRFRQNDNVVDFVGVNGNVLYSYTAEQANSLTSLPDLPAPSSRLSPVRWNFTLEQMKLQLGKYGKCIVGAVYETNDGQTWFDADNLNGFYPFVRFKYLGKSGTTTRFISRKGTSSSGKVLYDQTFAGTGGYSTKEVGAATWTGQLGKTRTQVSSDQPGSVHLGEFLTGLSANNNTSRFTANASLYQNMYMGNNIDGEVGDNVFNVFKSLSSVSLNPQIQRIGENAFRNSGLGHITIPDGTTDIGPGAFQYCYELKSVSIPESVSSIGASAFMGCTSLENINIPTSIRKILPYIFSDCQSLKKITIPDNVSSIGTQAFSGTGIEEISIPSSIVSLSPSAFSECKSLKRADLPGTLSSIPRGIFLNCSNLISGVHNAPNVQGTVGPSAYQSCSSMKVWVHSNMLSSIQNNAFRGCNAMQYFTAPSTLKSIGEYAFYGTYGVSQYDFTWCTRIPTLENSNAFNLRTTAKIIVPSELYSNWRKASNWKNLSTMIQSDSE